jgi:NAD-dependent deacetylase
MEKKKILVFSGAGVSAESGVETFRSSGGLWHDHKVEDVATPDGWKKDREKVLNFYNARRAQMKTVEPNLAHHIIKELENDFEVMVVTQNVDNLHERAGSSDIVHLHGELSKSRSTLNPKLVYDCDGDINIGDKCEEGSQLRPHIVWFNEPLDYGLVNKACNFADEADICIVVGTSMQVAPANTIPFMTPENCLIYYVDPGKSDFEIPVRRRVFFNHIKENATTGMEKVKNKLKEIFLED